MMPRPRYLVAVNLALLAAIGYVASSIIDTTIAVKLAPEPIVHLSQPPAAPAARVREPSSYYETISARDIFNSTKPAAPPAPEAPRESVLQARLWGVALRSEGESSCVIEDLTKKRQALYKVGDSVQGVATVARIEWERVILARNGEEEVLELVPERRLPRLADSGTTSLARLSQAHFQLTGENQYVIDRSEFESVLGVSMNQLATQMHVEPVREAGEIAGYRLSAIRAGSLFGQIGFRDGDIIRHINGTELNNGDGAGAFPDFHTVPELNVEVQRNGRMQNLHYRFR